ncbi:MAG: AAA family ATPase [Gammaproteobacteria bacterium]
MAVESAVNAVVLGQREAVRLLTIATFARGHVLLEGDVGVGKTTVLRALARAIGGAFERIEGTVDLMPSDLVYYTYVNEEGRPHVDPGPLLKAGEDLSVFFFNEINRARPQVHSLMLRVMAERAMSGFNRLYRLPHLQVFADRNRVEKDETYEIPAAARDRFLMEITIETPHDTEIQRALMTDPRFHDTDVLIEQIAPCIDDFRALNALAAEVQQRVATTATLERYALDLCIATRDPGRYGVRLSDVPVDEVVQAGMSPRGMSMVLRAARVAAWLDGRDSVLPEDLHTVFRTTATHRVFLTPVYEMRRSEVAPALISAIMEAVAAP